MKKLIVLILLVSVLVVNCSYFEGAEKERRERDWECRYNYKGEMQHCGYLKNIIKEMARVKNLVILVILILTAISCSYVESGERQLRERGWECLYNGKGEVQVCGFIN